MPTAPLTLPPACLLHSPGTAAHDLAALAYPWAVKVLMQESASFLITSYLSMINFGMSFLHLHFLPMTLNISEREHQESSSTSLEHSVWIFCPFLGSTKCWLFFVFCLQIAILPFTLPLTWVLSVSWGLSPTSLVCVGMTLCSSCAQKFVI